MDYNNAVLHEVEYSWSSGTMARASFYINVNEQEIVKADYYPETVEDGNFEMHHRNNESITERDWKNISDAVKILCPVLEECESKGKVKEIISNIAAEQILDGGDRFNFTIGWIIDGKHVKKTYYEPEYQRFRVLTTILQELADPIGREIPKYSEPELLGVWLTTGKKAGRDRYSFQCKKDLTSESEYNFFCYYPSEGKEVRYPKNKVNESDWFLIYDRIKSLKIKETDVGGKPKKKHNHSLLFK